MFTTSNLNNGSKTKSFTFKIPTGTEFKSVKDLEVGNTYKARLLYINKKSKFGDAPVVVTDDSIINLPKHLLEDVKTMINDPEAVTAVNEGRVGFIPYEYESKQYGTCYSIKWTDIEPDDGSYSKTPFIENP